MMTVASGGEMLKDLRLFRWTFVAAGFVVVAVLACVAVHLGSVQWGIEDHIGTVEDSKLDTGDATTHNPTEGADNPSIDKAMARWAKPLHLVFNREPLWWYGVVPMGGGPADIAWRPDGKRLAVISGYNPVFAGVLDLGSGIQTNAAGKIRSVGEAQASYTPDGLRLIMPILDIDGPQSDFFGVFDAQSVRLVAQVPGPLQPWQCNAAERLVVSRDGTTIAASPHDDPHLVVVFDTRDLKPTRTFTIKHKVAESLALSPDGRWLAIGSYETITLCTVADGTCGTPVMAHPRSTVAGLEFLANGLQLVSVTTSHAGLSGAGGQVPRDVQEDLENRRPVKIWSVPELRLEAQFDRGPNGARGTMSDRLRISGGELATHPSLPLVSVIMDGFARLIDARSGAVVSILADGYPSEEHAHAVKFSPDGKCLAIHVGIRIEVRCV
jgi:WD40 repeat protein